MRIFAVLAVAAVCMGSGSANGCNGEKDFSNNIDLPSDVKLKVGQEIRYKIDPAIHGFITKIQKRKPPGDTEYYLYEVRWLMARKTVDPKTSMIINEIKEFQTLDVRDFEVDIIDR